MKIYYDFHIHSCLSPCSSDDMTPNNIVGMSVLKGLDAIAITDHNSCLNVGAVLQCAKEFPLIVLPGMELETREEVHMLCLFEKLDDLLVFYQQVKKKMPSIKNRKDIFGDQNVMDHEDQVIAQEEDLLIAACDISMDEAVLLCRNLGGVIIPAHIDREANSMITNLGFISPDYHFSCLELSNRITEEEMLQKQLDLKNYRFIHNSDAHMLENIAERNHYMEVDEKNPASILRLLKKY